MYEKLLGMVFLGVGGGGTPPPALFCQKVPFFAIFRIYHQNLRSQDQKKLGVGTRSLRGSFPPLKFFLRFRLGLARGFYMHFAMVGLVVFGLVLAFNISTLPW